MADVKKKLKFLKKNDRLELVETIKNEKTQFAESFKEEFSSKYKDYVKYFPIRKLIFNMGITFQIFSELINLLLDKVLELFVEYEKKNRQVCPTSVSVVLFYWNGA